MNLTFVNSIVGLTLIMVTSCAAHAGLLEETCDHVFKQLGSGPYESLTKAIENFTDEGKCYRGCVIRLYGNANYIIDTQRPNGLFGPLPYCPEGKLPADLLNEGGWCGDRMADGPDGTSFKAIKENIFCGVEGSWNGGDDSDPEYVPSSRYEVIVRCAIK